MSIPVAVQRAVRARAHGRCECCLLLVDFLAVVVSRSGEPADNQRLITRDQLIAARLLRGVGDLQKALAHPAGTQGARLARRTRQEGGEFLGRDPPCLYKERQRLALLCREISQQRGLIERPLCLESLDVCPVFETLQVHRDWRKAQAVCPA